MKRLLKYVFLSVPCRTNSISIHFKFRFINKLFSFFNFDRFFFKSFLFGPTEDIDINKFELRKDPNPHYW